jgi:hypothetical protein
MQVVDTVEEEVRAAADDGALHFKWGLYLGTAIDLPNPEAAADDEEVRAAVERAADRARAVAAADPGSFVVESRVHQWWVGPVVDEQAAEQPN